VQLAQPAALEDGGGDRLQPTADALSSEDAVLAPPGHQLLAGAKVTESAADGSAWPHRDVPGKWHPTTPLPGRLDGQAGFTFQAGGVFEAPAV